MVISNGGTAMDRKLILGIVGVVLVIIILVLPVFQACEDVPYNAEEKEEVPVNYKITQKYCQGTGILDWEIECVVTVENVDSVGGTFRVAVKFYDGGNLAYTASDSKYIGPGQTATFRLSSSGLSFSTDWKDRYSVKYDIDPPTKIQTRIVRKYRRECRAVNLLQLLLGE